MLPEEKYDFKKRMLSVHKKNVRNMNLTPGEDEYEIKHGFCIVLGEEPSDVVLTAAKDFVDYLFTSMRVSAMLVEGDNCPNRESLVIIFDEKQSEDYIIRFDDNITLIAKTDRMASQGLYCLEDMMNTRRAPFVKKETIKQRSSQREAE